MARPRKWASESERIAAYRARKAQEAETPVGNSSEIPTEEEPATVPGSSSSSRRVGGRLGEAEPIPSSMPDLETYVADAVFMAELHHSQASPGATMSTKTLAEQIENAERYARWRYAGVLDGTVGSL